MSQPESKLSREILTALRMRGHFCFKVHGSEHMMAGLPDIIACVNGHFVGLETKMPGQEKNTSARQDYVHGLIELSGGVVEVVSSVDHALRVLESRAVSGAPRRRETS